ncbi:MAG: hypothetical protein F4W90_02660 [Gammaproteobacteria bacterium]|nr:hypothetical protein [Gammaproteobacteria bacterium]
MFKSYLENQVAVVALAFAAIVIAWWAFTSVAQAQEDDVDDYLEELLISKWEFECHDRVNGCSEGGLLYHTQMGPEGSVYFIAHYPETGNVYAREVRFGR